MELDRTAQRPANTLGVLTGCGRSRGMVEDVTQSSAARRLTKGDLSMHRRFAAGAIVLMLVTGCTSNDASQAEISQLTRERDARQAVASAAAQEADQAAAIAEALERGRGTAEGDLQRLRDRAEP